MFSGVARAEDTNKTEAAPQPGGTPKIVFDKTVYDFGTTSMVSSVTGTFTFHNAGDAVLEMKKPTTSCGCTVAGVKPEKLNPGENGELVFTVTIAKYTARTSLEKRITVPSNDPQSPNVGLTIKVVVAPVFEVSPDKVSLGDLLQGTTTNATIHIKRLDGKKLELTKVESTSNLLRAQLVPVESSNGTEAEIRVETTSKGPSHFFNYEVRAFGDNTNQPAATIAVSGRIVGDLDVMPPELLLGILDPDRWDDARPEQKSRGFKVVSNKQGATLEIKNLTTSLKDLLTLSVVTLQTGKAYQIVASLPHAPKETIRGTVSFETNIAGQQTVVVPVTINVLKR